MSYKTNISLEKKESGYSASYPEITDQQFEGDSLDIIFAELKKAIQLELRIQEKKANKKVNKPIWEVAQSLIQDITEDELNLLPTNGAEQHYHYIYYLTEKPQKSPKSVGMGSSGRPELSSKTEQLLDIRKQK